MTQRIKRFLETGVANAAVIVFEKLVIVAAALECEHMTSRMEKEVRSAAQEAGLIYRHSHEALVLVYLNR